MVLKEYSTGALRQEDNKFKFIDWFVSGWPEDMVDDDNNWLIDILDDIQEIKPGEYPSNVRTLDDIVDRRLGVLLHKNKEKYKDIDNWLKGMPIDRSINGLFRHLSAYVMGMDDEDHLAAMLFNVLSILVPDYLVATGKAPKEYLDLGVNSNGHG